MFWGNLQEIRKIVRELPISHIQAPSLSHRTHPSDLSDLSDPALEALAQSIRENGIIEPLLVRRNPEIVSRETFPYLLIAGERRLRAAIFSGLDRVPAVCLECDQEDAAALAIVENLHREDLSMFEESSAIASLIHLTGMTQEQCAKRLSVSQSYVANKLRLQRLTAEERTLILENALTERHARALLRYDAGEERLSVLKTLIERRMNVAQTEDYIESMLCAKSRAEELTQKHTTSEQRQKLLIRDIRVFCNSIDHAVDVVRKSGIPVEAHRQDTEDGTLISIRLPSAG